MRKSWTEESRTLTQRSDEDEPEELIALRVDSSGDRDAAPVLVLASPNCLPALLGCLATRSGRRRQLSAARRVARDFSARGFCVCDGGLASHVVAAAVAEVSSLALSPGGFVQNGVRLPSADPQGPPPSRRDLVCMLSVVASNAAAIKVIDGALECFGRNLLDALAAAADDPEDGVGELGTGPAGGILSYAGRSDMQIARYPGGGSGYTAHVDNGDGDGRTHDLGRVLTLVYYLTDMSACDGGALRLHLLPTVAIAEPAVATANEQCTASATCTAVVDVVPRAGMLVAFRADKVMHEVRPCWRDRFALTVWILAK